MSAFNGWNYDAHPSHKRKLRGNHQKLMRLLLRSNQLQLWNSLLDTRNVHKILFGGLVLKGEEGYVGNYRGDPRYGYLKNYDVTFGGKNGAASYCVETEMEHFKNKYLSQLNSLKGALDLLGTPTPPTQQSLQMLITVAAAMVVEFIEIHPYADGNGHIARYMVTALLYGGCGAMPLRYWRIEPRPCEPTIHSFVDAVIAESAGGDELKKYILDCYCE